MNLNDVANVHDGQEISKPCSREFHEMAIAKILMNAAGSFHNLISKDIVTLRGASQEKGCLDSFLENLIFLADPRWVVTAAERWSEKSEERNFRSKEYE